MQITLTMSRYGHVVSSNHITVREAVQQAHGDVEHSNANTTSLVVDGLDVGSSYAVSDAMEDGRYADSMNDQQLLELIARRQSEQQAELEARAARIKATEAVRGKAPAMGSNFL